MLTTITVILISSGLIGLYIWQRNIQTTAPLTMNNKSNGRAGTASGSHAPLAPREETPLILERRKNVRRIRADRRIEARYDPDIEDGDRRKGRGRRKEDKLWCGGYSH